MPTSIVWIRRQEVLHRLIGGCCASPELDDLDKGIEGWTEPGAGRSGTESPRRMASNPPACGPVDRVEIRFDLPLDRMSDPQAIDRRASGQIRVIDHEAALDFDPARFSPRSNSRSRTAPSAPRRSDRTVASASAANSRRRCDTDRSTARRLTTVPSSDANAWRTTSALPGDTAAAHITKTACRASRPGRGGTRHGVQAPAARYRCTVSRLQPTSAAIHRVPQPSS